MLVTQVVDELAPVPAAERDRLAGLVGGADVHARALTELGALRAVEVRQAAAPRRPEPSPELVRVVAWNVERGRDPAAIASVLAGTGAEVALLTELDVGMARTAQRHVPAEVAATLGHGYVFGVEFVELGLGSRGERDALAARAGQVDQVNQVGLHGAAVLTDRPLRRPALVRLDVDGAWFVETWRDEPRVGGRMAVLATVPWGDGELVVVSVHLESHGDPAGRADQLDRLLAAVEGYAEGRPVVVGGDLNTFSAPGVEIYSSRLRRELAADDPDRFEDPVRYEPLFEVAAARGYRWDGANAPGPTQRSGASGSPRPPLMRLDWLLVRGVEVAGPATLPAVGPDGTVLSDHDLVAVTVAQVTDR